MSVPSPGLRVPPRSPATVLSCPLISTPRRVRGRKLGTPTRGSVGGAGGSLQPAHTRTLAGRAGGPVPSVRYQDAFGDLGAGRGAAAREQLPSCAFGKGHDNRTEDGHGASHVHSPGARVPRPVGKVRVTGPLRGRGTQGRRGRPDAGRPPPNAVEAACPLGPALARGPRVAEKTAAGRPQHGPQQTRLPRFRSSGAWGKGGTHTRRGDTGPGTLSPGCSTGAPRGQELALVPAGGRDLVMQRGAGRGSPRPPPHRRDAAGRRGRLEGRQGRLRPSEALLAHSPSFLASCTVRGLERRVEQRVLYALKLPAAERRTGNERPAHEARWPRAEPRSRAGASDLRPGTALSAARQASWKREEASCDLFVSAPLLSIALAYFTGGPGQVSLQGGPGKRQGWTLLGEGLR